MVSGIICQNCGKQMKVRDIAVYFDEEQNDRFVDILYECVCCPQTAYVARYRNEYVFCNIRDKTDVENNYKPDMKNREVIHVCFHYNE